MIRIVSKECHYLMLGKGTIAAFLEWLWIQVHNLHHSNPDIPEDEFKKVVFLIRDKIKQILKFANAKTKEYCISLAKDCGIDLVIRIIGNYGYDNYRRNDHRQDDYRQNDHRREDFRLGPVEYRDNTGGNGYMGPQWR